MDYVLNPPDPTHVGALVQMFDFHPHQHHNTSWHDPDGGHGPNHDAHSHRHIDTHAHDGHQRRHPRASQPGAHTLIEAEPPNSPYGPRALITAPA